MARLVIRRMARLVIRMKAKGSLLEMSVDMRNDYFHSL